jgi:hypothetical protein
MRAPAALSTSAGRRKVAALAVWGSTPSGQLYTRAQIERRFELILERIAKKVSSLPAQAGEGAETTGPRSGQTVSPVSAPVGGVQ